MPKSIIIKSNTHNIIEQLVNELYQYPNIRFFKRRINGEETLVIKCFNYYNLTACFNLFSEMAELFMLTYFSI